MRSIDVRRMSYLSVAALVLSGSVLIAAPSVPGAGPPAVSSEPAQSSARASQLLEEIQSIAYELRRDAGTLESYTRSKLGWHSHANQLARAKHHINAIGDRIERLQAIRNSAALWQQGAIDSIVPVAMQLASRTEAAIHHVNETRGNHLLAPSYADHLNAIAENAGQMKESVNLFLNLADTQDKLDRLRNKAAATES